MRKKQTLSALSKDCRERDDYTCQVCGSVCNLTAHHIHHRSLRPDLTFDLANLVTLCGNCHKKVHNVWNLQSGVNPANIKHILV